MCQRDAKIACIVLVSEEHDDVAEFKRYVRWFWNVLLLNSCSSTLTDAAFVKSLYDNGIVVWGGDVRDQDAWSGKDILCYAFLS
jgi:FAS-associated factor 2